MPDGRKLHLLRIPPTGTISGEREIDTPTALNSFNFFNSDPSAASQPGDAGRFMRVFGPVFHAALFLPTRIIATSEVGNFDYETGQPSADFHLLHISPTAQDELCTESERVFRKTIWLDYSRTGILCLRVAEPPDVPQGRDRYLPGKTRHCRRIEEEGDGYRSYLAICIALLLAQRPVFLIDEPELCLHPPQAYEMGKFLGTHSQKPDTATIVATHSSHLVRGVLDTGNSVQIVRLTRSGGRFHAHHVEPSKLTATTAKAALRTEINLDGVFSDAVVVVEADGDRSVYQAAWEVSERQSPLDILMVPVGGTGGFSGPLEFFRSLRIPIAVVADLDHFLDTKKFSTILSQLSCPPDELAKLLEEGKALEGLILGLKQEITPEEAAAELIALAKKCTDWAEGKDDRIMEELSDIKNRIDKVRRLKKGGLSAFDSEPGLRGRIEALIEKCKQWGLFLVPVGELEWWLPELMNDVSRRRKPLWASMAPARIRANPEKAGDIIGFVSKVAGYLRANR
jgi:hypothetical protein